jgi:hypothetical protein
MAGHIKNTLKYLLNLRNLKLSKIKNINLVKE